jgi:hypothetical protein
MMDPTAFNRFSVETPLSTILRRKSQMEESALFHYLPGFMASQIPNARLLGCRNGVGAGFGQLQTFSGGHTYGRVEKNGHFGSAKAIIQ